jgi:Tfp pilus assembly protein PilZ
LRRSHYCMVNIAIFWVSSSPSAIIYAMYMMYTRGGLIFVK